jgi:hypothetical protein
MKFSRFFYSIILFFLWVTQPAAAQEVIEVLKQSRIKTDEASSAQDKLMSQAIENISYENIKAIIGEEKTERSKDLIKNKIIRQSDKYVLSIQGSNFVKKDNEYLMDFQMKVSLKSLRAFLLEQGLLYQIDGPPKLLPFIEITDRVVGQSFGWWHQVVNKDNRFLSDQLDVLHTALRDELSKIGFFGINPVVTKMINTLPESYRYKSLQRADYLFLGDYFKSAIILKGELVYKLKPNTEGIYLIDVHMQALHSSNGRVMAEVARVYESKPGSHRVILPKKLNEIAPKIAEDLSVQLADTWKRGTFGASILRLAVESQMSPKAYEEFKKSLVLQVRDIKSLRERLIQAAQVTYEVDSSVVPQKLAQALSQLQMPKYKIEVRSVEGETITIRVQSL